MLVGFNHVYLAVGPAIEARMRARRLIHWFLMLFGTVVGVSFSYGAYLMHLKQAPSEEVAVAPQSGADVAALVRVAARHLESRHVEQALIAYRQALTLDPHSIDAVMGLAHGELMAGREPVAAREYERVLTLDHENSAARQELARLYSHQRPTWSQSERFYKEFLSLQPDDATMRLELARLLTWERKAGEAVEMFSSDAVQRQMNYQDQKSYAFDLVDAGRTNEAEGLLKKLLAERSKDSEIELRLASMYAVRRDWDSAIPLYASLLHNAPEDARLNLTYGMGLLATKRYQAALGPLEKARKAMPSNTEAAVSYSRALKGSGNLKKAAEEFHRGLSNTQDPGLVREYADLLLEKEDYREAEKSYKQALRLGLRDYRLLMGLAGALRGTGKYREALPYLEEAYALQPADRTAFELATTLQKVGRHKEALALLSKIEKPGKIGSE
jgi:tetratricopeptide (TPR) repeat protein